MLKQHFGIVAKPGEKLHIRDPRPLLDDLHFRMTEDGPVEISRQAFFTANDDSAADNHSVAGFELDSVRAMYFLHSIDAVRSKRDNVSMVWAVQFSPKKFDAEFLKYLNGVSNVEEIDLAGTNFTDADLKSLPALPKLVGLGLSRTQVTDQGIKQLLLDRREKFPRLEFIVAEGTNVSDELVQQFDESP